MTRCTYPITVEKEGKQYYVYIEDLPGIYGLGPTVQQAKNSILTGNPSLEHATQEDQPLQRTRVTR